MIKRTKTIKKKEKRKRNCIFLLLDDSEPRVQDMIAIMLD